MTGRVANLLIILTVHNGLQTEIYRYSNSKGAPPCQMTKNAVKSSMIQRLRLLLNTTKASVNNFG